MRTTIQAIMAFAAFQLFAVPVHAQSPYGQMHDPQAILNQMPYMQGMQEFQAKYERIKKEREQERRAITDGIYEEELARAKAEQATQGPFYDPYAAAEVAAKRRVEQLTPQWKQEDQALDRQMQEEMMSSTGMGAIYGNQPAAR